MLAQCKLFPVLKKNHLTSFAQGGDPSEVSVKRCRQHTIQSSLSSSCFPLRISINWWIRIPFHLVDLTGLCAWYFQAKMNGERLNGVMIGFIIGSKWELRFYTDSSCQESAKCFEDFINYGTFVTLYMYFIYLHQRHLFVHIIPQEKRSTNPWVTPISCVRSASGLESSSWEDPEKSLFRLVVEWEELDLRWITGAVENKFQPPFLKIAGGLQSLSVLVFRQRWPIPMARGVGEHFGDSDWLAGRKLRCLYQSLSGISIGFQYVPIISHFAKSLYIGDHWRHVGKLITLPKKHVVILYNIYIYIIYILYMSYIVM